MVGGYFERIEVQQPTFNHLVDGRRLGRRPSRRFQQRRKVGHRRARQWRWAMVGGSVQRNAIHQSVVDHLVNRRYLGGRQYRKVLSMQRDAFSTKLPELSYRTIPLIVVGRLWRMKDEP